LRSEDMLRHRAGQSPTRLHTDCLDRLQTAVMPQTPFATALAASHPHNRLHCLLVKEQSGDGKRRSPRCRIAFNTERTVTHTNKQFLAVQRPGELFFQKLSPGRPGSTRKSTTERSFHCCTIAYNHGKSTAILSIRGSARPA